MTREYERPIRHRYEDPLETIWRRTAARLGMAIERSPDAWASWDGDERLTVAPREALDADDNLGQIVLHELCHALVAGPRGRRAPDWGLGCADDRDLVAEQAAQRLQAALADRYGLRGFMAVTTQWRPYWDTLPEDPLAPGDDPAIELAMRGLAQARQWRWEEPLEQALEATARLAAAVRGFAGDEPDALWSRAQALHPVGFPLREDGNRTCGTCAWRYRVTGEHDVDRCRQAAREGGVGPSVHAAWAACDRWEPPLTDDDCALCGACCREGFHLAPVEPDEPIRLERPDLLARDEHGAHLPRPDGRCVCLTGDGHDLRPFRCVLYALRPRACRDFGVAGDHCLTARRRVGLSK